MNCPKCGQNIQPEDVFCGNCGTKLQSVTTETTGITSSETTNKETLDKRTKETKEHVQSTLTDVNHHQNINQSVVNQNDTHHPVNQTFEQARTNEKDFLNELKEFFINAFKRPDQVIKDNQTFSFRILITLIVAGLLLISLFTTMLIPSQVGLFEIQKEDILLRFVLSLAIILAIHIGITYAVVRLTVIPEIKFNKLLSDYVIINTFTVALLIFSGIIFALNSYKFAALIFIVSFDNNNLMTVVSGVLSCFNNIGPMIGTTESFSIFSPLSKFLLSLAMIAGRLEIYPMLLLFLPKTWSRR